MTQQVEPVEQAEPATSSLVDSAAVAWTLLLVLALLTALWGSFLVPFRVAGTLVPVCWVVALAGNVLLAREGGRLAGRAGAAVPGLVWLLVALPLAVRRPEGDVVVTGGIVGLVFLLAGSLGAAVAFGLVSARPRAARA